MCGIAGIIDFNQEDIDTSLLPLMNSQIQHRGDDDEGYILIDRKARSFVACSGKDSPQEVRAAYPSFDEAAGKVPASVGLCHRRFSIIDLSPRGHQPFLDRDKTCCLVFNGEIYNYLELKEELKREGVVFETESDTEVLLEAYKKWDSDCFRRLNGFWALALYDFKRGQLILSRDRIGKKPLYWTRKGSRLYFASEIKALLAVPEISATKSVNEDAIYPWLAYSQRDLDCGTFFYGIHTFPSGTWSAVDARFPANVNRYWELPDRRLAEADISISEACQSIRETLENAVSIRLRADVPVGVELSGGMDSSTLVALASSMRLAPISTFTVRFEDPKYNEEAFAMSIAQTFHTDHSVIDYPFEDFWMHIKNFTFLEEEPYHAPNLHTNQVIWNIMRSQGTKVSINGAAGDELFAGYSQYFQMAQTEFLLRGQIQQFIRNSLHWTESESCLRTCMLMVNYLAKLPIRKIIPARLLKLRSGNHANVRPTRNNCLYTTLTPTLQSHMSNSLMPYWLRSGDKGYMGVPLELRAPFLDYRMVDLAFTLPIAYLIRDGWHKWILRKAFEEILPQDVLWRKKKLGFPFDIGEFLHRSNNIVEMIAKRSSNPYIDFTLQKGPVSRWQALSFTLWYELFFNSNMRLFDDISENARRTHQETDYGWSPLYLNTPFLA